MQIKVKNCSIQKLSVDRVFWNVLQMCFQIWYFVKMPFKGARKMSEYQKQDRYINDYWNCNVQQKEWNRKLTKMF